jgi:hypothetical protein
MTIHRDEAGSNERLWGVKTMTMAAAAASDIQGRRMTGEEKKVIFASSLGAVFEW